MNNMCKCNQHYSLTANLPSEGDEIEGGVLDGDDDVDGLRRLAVERIPERDGAAVAVHAEVVAADGELHAAALGVAPAQVVHLQHETREPGQSVQQLARLFPLFFTRIVQNLLVTLRARKYLGSDWRVLAEREVDEVAALDQERRPVPPRRGRRGGVRRALGLSHGTRLREGDDQCFICLRCSNYIERSETREQGR